MTPLTLPHEILGEIFAQSSAVHPDAPIVLGAVSRLFRHVAYTTPPAWSHLKLCDTDDGRKTTLWFEMAKACQVDVQVDMAPTARRRAAAPGPGVDNATVVKVRVSAAVEALRLYTDRIASLYLRTNTQAQACAVLNAIYSDLPPEHTPALRSLRISVTVVAPDPRATFPAVRSITNLETTNVALGALVGLDLARLQRLRVAQPLVSPPVAAEDILELVHTAPGLRWLAVDARIADPLLPAGKSAECRVLERLAELRLRANNLVALLDRVKAPELRVLRLDDLDGKRAGASAEMGAALLRQLLGRRPEEDSLRVFELAGVEVECGDAVWEQCLKRLKGLEVFKVDSPGKRGARDDVVAVDASPKEGRRPIKAGFGFGFGAVDVGDSVGLQTRQS
ncbi:hypothetical protein C8R46DRAFT_980193 [Mycena filopes]|nr:hypothetical protein C8R46DRAFT_980193 [Mycena filopes]